MCSQQISVAKTPASRGVAVQSCYKFLYLNLHRPSLDYVRSDFIYLQTIQLLDYKFMF